MKVAVPLQGGVLLIRVTQFSLDREDSKQIQRWIAEQVDRAFEEARKKKDRPALLILGPSLEAMFIGNDGQVEKLGGEEPP